MSKKSVNGAYWQKPPAKRDQLVLIPVSLEEKIPDGHPVRMIDEILVSVPVGIERTFPVAGMRFWKSVIPMLQLIG